MVKHCQARIFRCRSSVQRHTTCELRAQWAVVRRACEAGVTRVLIDPLRSRRLSRVAMHCRWPPFKSGHTRGHIRRLRPGRSNLATLLLLIYIWTCIWRNWIASTVCGLVTRMVPVLHRIRIASFGLRARQMSWLRGPRCRRELTSLAGYGASYMMIPSVVALLHFIESLAGRVYSPMLASHGSSL